MKQTALEDLNLSVFTPLVNSKFFVCRDSGEPVELVLVEAKPVLACGTQVDARTGSFSLIFHGPDTHFLPQQIHTFQHETLGWFSLFIVPIGEAQGIFEYQAVFNRLA
jgi:Domain of unknown function (DUF6916)